MLAVISFAPSQLSRVTRPLQLPSSRDAGTQSRGAEDPDLTDAKGSHADKSKLAMATGVNIAQEPGASCVVADRQLACTLVCDMICARKLEFAGSKLNADNDSALDLMQQIKMNICNVDAPVNSLYGWWGLQMRHQNLESGDKSRVLEFGKRSTNHSACTVPILCTGP